MAGAEVGQVLTVVSVDGWHDYTGHGAFGERFTAEEKGLPDEDWVGSATITAVDGEGRVTLDRPLPPGDAVYLADAWTLPEEGVASSDLAGHPGFAFARVMVGPDGERMTPHHRAVDLAVDNRLLPVSSWTSSHSFEGGCAEPSVEARLIYRAWPTWLADERGWPATDRVMAVGVP